MSSFFTPRPRTVSEILRRDVTYVIPEYQRPYSWDCLGKSEKNNQINVMWDDLYAAFMSDPKELYFFGSMVLIGNDGDLNYEVVDGQQRITSTALLFVAIRCFFVDQLPNIADETLKTLIKENIINKLDELIYNDEVFGAITKTKKIKIERNAGFDYDSRLSDVFACNVFDPNSLKGLTDEQTEVITRYYNNKEYFQERLAENFRSEDGSFDSKTAERLNEFIAFLKNKVSIVEILTMKLEIAYHIFEILNNRGLPLSNKDLFRNFILKEFDKLKNSGEAYNHIDPSAKWQELDEDNILDNEFLSRWVESTTAAQQKKSAYNDIEEIYRTKYKDEGLKKKIEIFHADIKSALPYYQKIMERDFENPRLKQKINVIMNAGNTKYSINFLMALLKYSKGEETEDVLDLVNRYEKLIWYYAFVTRFTSSDSFRAIALLNQGYINAVKDLLRSYVGKEGYGNFLMQISDKLYSNDIAKLLIAKYAWIIESETSHDTVNQVLNYDACSLEHISPQRPAKDTNWVKDYPDDKPNSFSYLTYNLGNMTLVTHKLNSSMKNFDFSRKKLEYAKTKLAITYELSLLPDDKMTPNYLVNRFNIIVSKIVKDLEISPNDENGNK
jgi:uncharacterized protein with ParB-like and HNH nuclease domain